MNKREKQIIEIFKKELEKKDEKIRIIKLITKLREKFKNVRIYKRKTNG